MPITLTPSPSFDALELSGDICRTLPLPAERACGTVAIALSEGTLIEAVVTGEPGERFRIAREGAAITMISGDSVEVQWPVEWLTVSGLNQALAIERQPESMPLFPQAA